MKKRSLIGILLASCLCVPNAWSFCGFFVAKADAKLFNESSQVIVVRDGQKSTITMSNDFQGDVEDFAMVVPVPVVLAEKDIRVTERTIFEKLDNYSAPRLAEYYDENPCYDYDMFYESAEEMVMDAPTMAGGDMGGAEDLGVTIEAKYTVGEYDILILSAKESSGLKTWLDQNDYKIPQGAEEVLDPYIKSDMKFFVAKVNVKEQQKSGYTLLRPIQISFESDKFMLPIRLGMANANGDQDMLVYAFTKNGRVETTNYRTVKLPTDLNIPLFVQEDFGLFYKDLFANAYRRNEGKVVFLEYAWNLSANNMVKCDPCVSPPPVLADMQEAGVDWLDIPQNTFSSQYQGEVFFTRLHVRYNRENFPQDLTFQETPNKERYQGRYVIHHPATGDLNCDAAENYLLSLVKRKDEELHNLADLVGWDIMKWQKQIGSYTKSPKGEPTPEPEQQAKEGTASKSSFSGWLIATLLAMLGFGALAKTTIRQ